MLSNFLCCICDDINISKAVSRVLVVILLSHKGKHKKTSTLFVIWSFVLKTPAVVLVILQLYTRVIPKVMSNIA
jgi:hypothetical protein